MNEFDLIPSLGKSRILAYEDIDGFIVVQKFTDLIQFIKWCENSNYSPHKLTRQLLDFGCKHVALISEENIGEYYQNRVVPHTENRFYYTIKTALIENNFFSID